MNDEPNAAPSDRRSRKRIYAIAQWVIIPLVIIVAANEVIGRAGVRGMHWYPRAEYKAERYGRLDAIFVGSSRVGAAYREDAFEKEASKLVGRPIHAARVGRGRSTGALHYLGLRNLLASQGDRMRGSLIVIESTHGYPVETVNATWADRWVYDSMMHPLSSLMDASDLRRFLGTSAPFPTKVQVTARWLLRSVPLIVYKERVGFEVRKRWNDAVSRVAARVSPRFEQPEETAADLEQEGGIRTDRHGIELAKRRVVVDLSTKRELPEIRDWSERIVSDIVDLAREHDCKIVFVEMPLHSLQWELFEQPNAKVSLASFQRTANEWQAPVLSVPDAVTYQDQDFPDFMHMASSKAPGYSRAVARLLAPYLELPEAATR
jgi:hypothetical protein